MGWVIDSTARQFKMGGGEFRPRCRQFRSTVTAQQAQARPAAVCGPAVLCTWLACAAAPAVTKNVDSSTKNAEMAFVGKAAARR
jgi:hypothetical protein